MTPDQIFWFDQENGVLVQCSVGEAGLNRSAVFPGLWLDPQALLQGNRRRLRTMLDLGCSTLEHTAFVAKLAAAIGNALGKRLHSKSASLSQGKVTAQAA
jgi:hypothetical protein